MRTIPAGALTKLATDLGTEPQVILEVEWGGSLAAGWYADKAIPGTPVLPKILDLSDLDEIIQVSGGSQSQQLTVTLDDTDGAIKEIFDQTDVHKKSVRVWQWFEGLNFSTEKFLLFKGLINSPVTWDEGQRQFSFTIVNRIEDVEVGFSAEEGDFPRLPEDLIGKPWPLCFGTVINVPALKAVPAVSGFLAAGVGIKDFTIPNRIALAEDISCPITPTGFECNVSSGAGQYSATCNMAYEEDQMCLQAKCVELERLRLMLAEQTSYEYASIVVFGGERFPQGRTITLNINGGLFTGRFNGTTTVPINVFTIFHRRHPRDNGSGGVIQDAAEVEIKSRCPGTLDDYGDSDFVETIYGEKFSGARTSRLSWERYRAADTADFFWAGGGSTVTLQGGEEIIYIANILPSTILRVAAKRVVNGNEFLLTVPSQFYTIRQTDYSGYDVMEIVFNRPLSAEQVDTGGGWGDDIYVTLTSSVGPNTVDILEWFIETYTSYAIDSSFATVKPLIDKYPMHFPLLVRRNLLTVLKEIASLARCAIWQKNDTFFIKYLAATPTPVATLGEDDILTGTLQIELTKTEDLVTKYTQKWKIDYSKDKENTLILRHNVNRYGVQERTEDYYTFNILDLVRKAATFWIIRWSNTWKRIKFSTSLEWLNLEAFDAITLDLPDVAESSFVGIVEHAVYNSDTKQIDFEVWTPIKAGGRTPYNFAWPAAISANALFPTIDERNAGQAGSGTEPNFSTIAPPGHPLRTEFTGIYTGMTLRCNGDAQNIGDATTCRQDHGDSRPSDTGDVKPFPDAVADETGDISTGSSPFTSGGKGYFSDYRSNKDSADKAGSDAQKGRENAQRASDATTADGPVSRSGDDFRDFLENLPDPDDLDPEEHPCQARVTMSGRKQKQIITGGRPICVPDSPNFTEVVVWNDCSAAAAFASEQEATSNCSNQPPCSACKNVQFIACGCSNANPAMIGYSNSSSGGDDSFLF